MNEELESLYNWFDISREELIKGHEGEWVLVADKKSLGYFREMQDGAKYAKQNGLKVGQFLVQYCIPREREHSLFY